jgi:hypothetical protein
MVAVRRGLDSRARVRTWRFVRWSWHCNNYSILEIIQNNSVELLTWKMCRPIHPRVVVWELATMEMDASFDLRFWPRAARVDARLGPWL